MQEMPDPLSQRPRLTEEGPKDTVSKAAGGSPEFGQKRFVLRLHQHGPLVCVDAGVVRGGAALLGGRLVQHVEALAERTQAEQRLVLPLLTTLATVRGAPVSRCPVLGLIPRADSWIGAERGMRCVGV